MTRSLAFALFLVVLSAPVAADGYSYQARIEGMVCAFCAYNVGKTIGTLKRVDAESVSVDLEAKLVAFHASGPVEWADVSTAFADSGFVLAKLDQAVGLPARISFIEGSPLIGIDLDGVEVERFEAILEAIGETASTQGLRLVIEAPEAVEIDLLRPLLMGRKHAINVRFVPIDEASMRLKMYSASVTPSQ